MIAIYTTIKNGVAYVRWNDTFDYYWILINGDYFDGPITRNYAEIDVKSYYKTIQVIGSDSATYDWSGAIESTEQVKNRIKVVFGGIDDAIAYRVMIDGSQNSGLIPEDGSDEYTYISTPITTSGLKTVDIDYQDAAGNWSSAAHLYHIHMYVVPAGTDFTVSAATGVLTIVEA